MSHMEGEVEAPTSRNEGRERREFEQAWGLRERRDVPEADAFAAAQRLAKIDAAWSRTATSCCESSPCYGCSLRALRVLELARELGWS